MQTLNLKNSGDYGGTERARAAQRQVLILQGLASLVVVLVPIFPFVILAALVRLAAPVVIAVLAVERNPRSEDAHIRFCRSVVVGNILGFALGTNGMADAFHVVSFQEGLMARQRSRYMISQTCWSGSRPYKNQRRRVSTGSSP